MAEETAKNDADYVGSGNAHADPNVEDVSNRRKRSDIARLLDFAGSRKWLTYCGLALSAVSQVLGFIPYVCIWLLARDPF